MSESLEDKIVALEKELRGTQEMLFLVLKQVGEPVEVPLDMVKTGIVGDHIIDLTLDKDAGCWTFQLKKGAIDDV